jgi:hypothetical protein
MPQTPLYSHKPTYYPTPGTGNYAFAPNMTLPALGIVGPGRATMAQMGIMQPVQAMSYPAIPTSGLGGLMAGQFVGQPLTVRNENG